MERRRNMRVVVRTNVPDYKTANAVYMQVNGVRRHDLWVCDLVEDVTGEDGCECDEPSDHKPRGGPVPNGEGPERAGAREGPEGRPIGPVARSLAPPRGVLPPAA